MKQNQEVIRENKQAKKREAGRIIKDKFEEERKARVIPLVAKNEPQKKALKDLWKSN